MKPLLFLALTLPLYAQDTPRPRLTAFRASQIAVAAATTADILSSRGLYERNPVLGRGAFTLRNQGAKVIATTAAALLLQEFLVRKFPQTRRAFTFINFGATGMHAGAAAHNWRQ